MRVENCSKNISEVGEEVHRRPLHEKSPNRCASRDAQRKIWKLAKKSIEDRSTKNLQTDVRRELLEGKFGGWRGSPSKIAPRKFPNRCAPRIARRKFWMSAKKSIEDRSTKVSLYEKSLFRSTRKLNFANLASSLNTKFNFNSYSIIILKTFNYSDKIG